MIRTFLAWACGWAIVDLQDFDGEVVRRIAKPTSFGLKAQRFGLGIRTVLLVDGGAIHPDCYVRRWAMVKDYRRVTPDIRREI